LELKVMLTGGLLMVGCVARAEQVQVELLEDEVAQVVDLSTGKAKVVPRQSLPQGTREGDVITCGKKDVKATTQARTAVKEARARAFKER
jgi:hypothetical protein